MAESYSPVSLPASTRKALAQVAAQSGKSERVLINRAVREFVQDYLDGIEADRRKRTGRRPISAQKVYRKLGLAD